MNIIDVKDESNEFMLSDMIYKARNVKNLSEIEETLSVMMEMELKSVQSGDLLKKSNKIIFRG